MFTLCVDLNFTWFRGMKCSHLFPGIGSSIEEFLLYCQNELGLKREWFQNDKKLPHFDVSLSKRRMVLMGGVEVIDNYGMIEIMKYWRNRNGF